MERQERPRSSAARLWVALSAVAIVACVGLVGAALASANGTPQPAAIVATVQSLQGREYPAVVARVNGEAISGKVLAQRVYGIEQAGPGAPAVANPVQTALNGLIQEAVLSQATTARGVAVTDADIQAFQQSQQQIFAKGGPTADQVLQAAAAAQGDSTVAQYWADPKTIAVERDIILLGKMRQQIIQQLPPAQQGSNAAQQQAISQFVAAQHARVDLYIHP